MAIAYVSSAKAVQGSVAATSYTTAFTTSSGTDRLLVVLTITNQSPGDIITGITYNGTSMTRRYAFDTLQGGQNVWMYGYTLVAPTTGANNVVVSFSATYNDDITVMTHEYTGVDQTTPTDGTNTDVLGASPTTTTITTTVDNAWLVSGARGASIGCAASTNTTERQSNTGAQMASGDTNAAQTPAGSKTQNWTVASGNATSGSVAIRPVAAASLIKTADELAIASVKTFDGLAIASVKTVNGLTNV